MQTRTARRCGGFAYLLLWIRFPNHTPPGSRNTAAATNHYARTAPDGPVPGLHGLRYQLPNMRLLLVAAGNTRGLSVILASLGGGLLGDIQMPLSQSLNLKSQPSKKHDRLPHPGLLGRRCSGTGIQ